MTEEELDVLLNPPGVVGWGRYVAEKRDASIDDNTASLYLSRRPSPDLREPSPARLEWMRRLFVSTGTFSPFPRLLSILEAAELARKLLEQRKRWLVRFYRSLQKGGVAIVPGLEGLEPGIQEWLLWKFYDRVPYACVLHPHYSQLEGGIGLHCILEAGLRSAVLMIHRSALAGLHRTMTPIQYKRCGITDVDTSLAKEWRIWDNRFGLVYANYGRANPILLARWMSLVPFITQADTNWISVNLEMLERWSTH